MSEKYSSQSGYDNQDFGLSEPTMSRRRAESADEEGYTDIARGSKDHHLSGYRRNGEASSEQVEAQEDTATGSLFEDLYAEIAAAEAYNEPPATDEDGRVIIPKTATPESDRSKSSKKMKSAERRANKYRVIDENREKAAGAATPSEPIELQSSGVASETQVVNRDSTVAPEAASVARSNDAAQVDSEPLVGAHGTSATATETEEAPLEGVIVSAPQHDSQPDTDTTTPPGEPDFIVGSFVDNSAPKNTPKAKKAKQPKQPKSPQATPPVDTSDATYSDDQVFGPEEDPLRKFVRTSETYNDARAAYDKADTELAGKVARRLKLGMFASKKTREAASAEVEAARPEYERMAEVFDAVQIEKWKLKDPTISDEDIRHKLAKYHEAKLRLQGLRAQNEILTSPGRFGKLSELNNKATEWFAGLSRKQKIIVGIGSVVVGAGAGLAVAAAGTVLGAGAGIAGAGLLAGAKVYKTTAQGRAGLHRNTTKVDKGDFKDADGKYKSIDDLRMQSSVSFKKSLDQRVENADKINKKTKLMTIASAALLGAGVAGHIDVIHDAYKAAGDHIADYFGMGDHHDVLPSDSQGGGSGNNPVSQMGSGDVNPHNQYSFPHHDAPVAPVAPPAPIEVVPSDMGGATEFNGAGLDHFNQWVEGHTVQPGESVWKLSQDYLQANGVHDPSVYQIDAVKDKVLAEFSAKGLVDGNGWLTAGQQLRIR